MNQLLQILCPEDATKVPHEVGKQYRMIVPGGFVPGHFQLTYVYLLAKKIKQVCIYRHRNCQHPVVGRLAVLTVGMFRMLPGLSVEVVWMPDADVTNPVDVVVIQCVDLRYHDLGRLAANLQERLVGQRLLLIRVPGARAPWSLLQVLRRIAPTPAQVIVLAHPDCAYERFFFEPDWARWWWRGKRPAEWTLAAAQKTWPDSQVMLLEDDYPSEIPH